MTKDWEWTGPNPEDLVDGTGDILLKPVPPERWPYGPPSHHEDGCILHAAGLYCDCEASANDDEIWGVSG